MRRDYSPINDLYGAEPEHAPSGHRRRGWLIVALGLASLFCYESIRPVNHLRLNPPPGFVEARSGLEATELRKRERMARSYWEMAVNSVQYSYPFGTALPRTPPPDFRLQDEGDPGTRILYWGKLCELWNQPATWATSYEWDTDWVKRALSSLMTVAKTYFHS